MRKTLVYIAVLAVLAIATWLILRARNGSVFSRQEAGFTVTDTAGIGKIFLSRNGGENITLTRTPDKGWLVNGRYPARPGAMAGMLSVLYRQYVVSPVPENMQDGVVRGMAGRSVKVEIYNRGGERIRTFYVGEEANEFVGTYMFMEGAQRPYVVTMPAFGGTLAPRYSTDLKDWRDRTVFRIAREDIRTVSVQYFDHPEFSFSIQQEGGRQTVTTDSAYRQIGPLNVQRLNGYLGFFRQVSCEAYADGIPDMDTLLRTVPKRCIVDVTGKNGYAQHVTVFWRPLNERSKNLATPFPDFDQDYDADKFFAVFNDNKDTALIQRGSFEKIFRPGYEFYQADQPKGPRPGQVIREPRS